MPAWSIAVLLPGDRIPHATVWKWIGIAQIKGDDTDEKRGIAILQDDLIVVWDAKLACYVPIEEFRVSEYQAVHGGPGLTKDLIAKNEKRAAQEKARLEEEKRARRLEEEDTKKLPRKKK